MVYGLPLIHKNLLAFKRWKIKSGSTGLSRTCDMHELNSPTNLLSAIIPAYDHPPKTSHRQPWRNRRAHRRCRLCPQYSHCLTLHWRRSQDYVSRNEKCVRFNKPRLKKVRQPAILPSPRQGGILKPSTLKNLNVFVNSHRNPISLVWFSLSTFVGVFLLLAYVERSIKRTFTCSVASPHYFQVFFPFLWN